jgi:hypothetical protein
MRTLRTHENCSASKRLAQSNALGINPLPIGLNKHPEMPRAQGVAGSNPVDPTIRSLSFGHVHVSRAEGEDESRRYADRIGRNEFGGIRHVALRH